MAPGMAAVFYGNRRQLFGRDAVFVHIALRDQCVGGGHADPEWAFELRMTHFGQRGDGPVARHAGKPVVAGHDQDVPALSAGDQRGGLHDHDASACAAGLDGKAGPGVDAQVLAEYRGQHQMRLGKRICADDAIDVVQAQACIGDGAHGGFGMQRHAAASRQLAHGGIVGARNESVHGHGLNPIWRAMMLRWMSLVPSPMSYTSASRWMRPTGYSRMMPAPPCMRMACSLTCNAVSVAMSLTLAAVAASRLPWSTRHAP